MDGTQIASLVGLLMALVLAVAGYRSARRWQDRDPPSRKNDEEGRR